MFALGEKPIRRCQKCARWDYDGEILCGNCGAPLTDMRPLSRRPGYVLAFAVVLTAVVTALLLIVRWLIA
jgi:uncharacterized OB-fold protein